MVSADVVAVDCASVEEVVVTSVVDVWVDEDREVEAWLVDTACVEVVVCASVVDSVLVATDDVDAAEEL